MIDQPPEDPKVDSVSDGAENVEEAFVRRDEAERSEKAQKMVAEKIEGMLKQAREYVVTSAT